MALGDIQIVNVDAPPTLLPGEQGQIIVDVQFFKQLANFYCRIYDNDIPGSEPFKIDKNYGSWSIGAYGQAVMINKGNHFMPDRPWNLRIEVGTMNIWGTPIYAADFFFVTIYPGSMPPTTCPDGSYYDAVSGSCVPYRTDGTDWPMTLFVGSAVLLLLVGIIYPRIKKKGS